MTVAKSYLAPRAVALKRLRYSYWRIAKQLGCSSTYAYLLVREHAPDLLDNRRPHYTKTYFEGDFA
jgi:hypothetical protein